MTLERETLHVMDDKQRIALVETKTVENGNPVARHTCRNATNSATISARPAWSWTRTAG